MSTPTTFALGRMFRRLGIKGGRYPGFSTGPIMPVAQVADLKSLAPEILEPRALYAASFGAVVATFPGFEIQAKTLGGVVIEQLTVENISTSASAVNFGFARHTTQTVGLSDGGFVEIGEDAAVLSNMQHGRLAAGAWPASQTTIFLQIGRLWTLNPELRIWVPPAAFFSGFSTTPNVIMTWSVVWREIEEYQGEP